MFHEWNSEFCCYSLIQHRKASKTSISWDGCEYQNITWINIQGLLVFMPMLFMCLCEGADNSCSRFQRTGKSFILCYTTKIPLQSHAKAPVLRWDLNAMFHVSQWTVTVMMAITFTSKSLPMLSCCLWKSKDPTFQKNSGVKAAGL